MYGCGSGGTCLLTPDHRKLRQEHHCEFVVSLGYIVGSSPAWDT